MRQLLLFKTITVQSVFIVTLYKRQNVFREAVLKSPLGSVTDSTALI